VTAPGNRWCADVAAVLRAASDQTARLAVRVAEDWLDERGREWAERVALIHRELDRMATEAADLRARIADPDTAPPLPATIGAGTGRRGPRLGGTAGERVDDTYGMRIAELPPG
jgi:hypothetical protein